jgi:hypothetical protein
LPKEKVSIEQDQSVELVEKEAEKRAKYLKQIDD